LLSKVSCNVGTNVSALNSLKQFMKNELGKVFPPPSRKWELNENLKKTSTTRNNHS
jgi:hypothetical protein